jgi:hypothetical protein
VVRLNADRVDPENREFKHSDPVGWTDRRRGEILKALYTLLLGNPRRAAWGKSGLAPAPTRFKEWWEMVGSAVENAAMHDAALRGSDGGDAARPVRIDFNELFAGSETMTRRLVICVM